MSKKLDPKIDGILKSYGFGPEACWDCHGVWVIYHRVLEQIASKAVIVFDQPFIVEANGEKGIAAVCVTGRMGEKNEWSIGEAAPANNKNAYPWAMAEKRGKDRVILKLLGLHGEVYSEEEADECPECQIDNREMEILRMSESLDVHKKQLIETQKKLSVARKFVKNHVHPQVFPSFLAAIDEKE